ncbi:MAG: hypothetical protein GYA14_08605 [Ignavibacteria bacterium]|nr:hypothetical protein [Ignavibacteria bacterium]
MKQTWSKIASDEISFVQAFVILVSGILIGLLFNDLPYISLEKKVNLGEIANFMLAIVIALYVPFYLNRKINIKRVDKDLAIEGCNSLYRELHRLYSLIETLMSEKKGKLSNAQAVKMLLRIRYISNMLTSLTDNYSSFTINGYINEVIEELKKIHIVFRDDVTFHLKDKNPKISDERYLNIEKTIFDYFRNIDKLKVYINQS